MAKTIVLLFLLLGHISYSIAETSIASECFSSPVKEVNYYSYSRGSVVLFILPTSYPITSAELNCIVGYKFLQSVKNFPDKLVIGLTDTTSKLQAVQWDLTKQTFILINVDLSVTEGPTGMFTIYPQPLLRIKEILINHSLPHPSQLPVEYRKIYKINYLQVTKDQLDKLINGY